MKIFTSLILVLVLAILFSCNVNSLDLDENTSLLENAENLEDEKEIFEKIETLYNHELKFVNQETNESLVLNIGSNGKENLEFYLSAYTIKIKVEGIPYTLENPTNLIKNTNSEMMRLLDSFDEEENKFEIKVIDFNHEEELRSLEISLEPVSKNNAQLQFPQSLSEFTSPSGHRWGRVNRLYVFGVPELNEPNTNPGYFIAYPYRRTCGLCFWNFVTEQTKDFPTLGDELIFGNDNWVRVRFRIRHDANNFQVRFKQLSSHPWF